ncbi:Uncharacterised protein [Escherichia coli]|nr:Uncharacterised protein [Escherichia coli]
MTIICAPASPGTANRHQHFPGVFGKCLLVTKQRIEVVAHFIAGGFNGEGGQIMMNG